MHYGIAANKRQKTRDMTGETVGNWTVVGRVGVNRCGAVVWELRCQCGATGRQTTGQLRFKNSHSCGCDRWTGAGAMPGKYWKSVLQKARMRGIEMQLTPDEAWAVYQSQDGKCALTGWGISFGNEMTASLDRIRSSEPYRVGNVQWVHKNVNWMKNRFSQERFIEVCHAVALKHPKPAQETA